MEIIKGDLLELASSGKAKVIVHGCNCFHAMGGGIAGAIAARFPQVPEVDKQFSKRGDPSKLGSYTAAAVNCELRRGTDGVVTKHQLPQIFECVNLYTQFTPGRDFIESVFIYGLQKLNKDYKGETLWFPKIGCGIGGANWERVEELLLTHLPDVNVKVVVL